MKTLNVAAAQLASGEMTSRELVETALAAIDETGGQGANTFRVVYRESALQNADRIDRARKHNENVPEFAGIPISIKDLFDVNGEVTTAGSHVLDEQPAASADADVVRHLRNAGFIIIGKTNMTEFAFSGLGINPHYGTPLSPYQRDNQHIPGGSSSGSAVSVADAMALGTLGTDTGGSCRIPAAFCGITGFKPSSARVSRRGVIPLSGSLDSVGPLANSVACCQVLDTVISGQSAAQPHITVSGRFRLGVLDTYVNEQLDDAVAAAFDACLSRLSEAGHQLVSLSAAPLIDLPQINQKGGLVGAEAYAWHRQYLSERADHYDPWVKARIEFASSQSAADYIDLLQTRAAMQQACETLWQHVDALVMPTVAITPPMLSELSATEISQQINLLCLRNTAVSNFLDRPAISIPCHQVGEAPVGCMLVGQHLKDSELLTLAHHLENAVRGAHV